jgi:hypothetical protein
MTIRIRGYVVSHFKLSKKRTKFNAYDIYGNIIPEVSLHFSSTKNDNKSIIDSLIKTLGLYNNDQKQIIIDHIVDFNNNQKEYIMLKLK